MVIQNRQCVICFIYFTYSFQNKFCKCLFFSQLKVQMLNSDFLLGVVLDVERVTGVPIYISDDKILNWIEKQICSNRCQWSEKTTSNWLQLWWTMNLKMIDWEIEKFWLHKLKSKFLLWFINNHGFAEQPKCLLKNETEVYVDLR
jgi:hypothetical protein